jgi:ABC-type transport system involved in multi-copper enzyme maturation permease subunit
MKASSLTLGLRLPLLAKELTELAARRRTYVVRVLYALLLCLGGLAVFYDTVYRYGQNSPLSVLGSGRQMFEGLVILQFVGIYLFGPALMAGALTQEKERNTLALLLITDLRPWEIVIQKLIGRMMPLLTFLVVSVPLMAVAYSFGGVSNAMLGMSVYYLLLTCLNVAALSLMMSAWSRSTNAAFIGSYVVGALVTFAPMLVLGGLWLLLDRGRGTLRPLRWLNGPYGESIVFCFMPFYHLLESYRFASPHTLFLWSLPLLGVTGVYLILARVFVIRRALVPPRDVLMLIFKKLDAFWQNANVITGGIVLVRERHQLPEDRPVKWREVHKRSLGKPQYLFRILTLTQAPVFVLVVAMLSLARPRSQSDLLTGLIFILWPIALLLIAVQAASALSSERSRQTLDVLLTTPLSSADIVRQKFAATVRLMLVLSLPFLTVIFTESWWEYGMPVYGYRYEQIVPTWSYLAGSLLSLVIYMPMMAWLSMWIGLRMKSPARATITAIAAIVGWIAAPAGVMVFAAEVLRLFPATRGTTWVLLVSPGTMVFFQETAFADIFGLPWPWVLVNYTIYGLIALWLRWLCLCNADVYLGRTDLASAGARGEVAA